jgi:hypothetical protein
MEFKGTKGKWELNTFRNSVLIDGKLMVTCWSESTHDLDEKLSSDESWLSMRERTENERKQRTDFKPKANALLISRSPILFEEHKKEIDFLKRVKKQLDELGGSMEFEVEERIIFLEKLCFESVNLQNN